MLLQVVLTYVLTNKPPVDCMDEAAHLLLFWVFVPNCYVVSHQQKDWFCACLFQVVT